MKEAVLSMISQMLMEDDQRTTMQKLFNFMDTSGDGSLSASELQKGFKEICDRDKKDEKGQFLHQDEDASHHGYKTNSQKYFELLDNLKNIPVEKSQNGISLKEVIEATDLDGNAQMDFNDFMMVTVDLSQDQF